MPKRNVALTGANAATKEALEARFAAIRAAHQVVPEFAPEVVARAEQVAANPLGLPDRDESAVPFLTIDPPGSMDLDQAMHIERAGDGYRVRYAIAHLVSFIEAGDPIDKAARERGVTVYSPDVRAPLHPTQLSESRASLLPGQATPAYIWDLTLDASGELTATDLYPAMVTSHDRLDYDTVQKQLDDGSADERLKLLAEVGAKRADLEIKRGGATLPMPEQEAGQDEAGNWTVEFRPLQPSSDFNAQISLLTGIAAAQIMLKGKIGILRTMPAPDEQTLGRLRHQARALGVDWPKERSYGEFLRGLDRTNSKHLALIHDATSLFRGAGYTAFDGQLPELTTQAAIAAPYAHVTAPLRRLVDRFGLATCAALVAGQEVPAWVREALPTLPEIMTEADRTASAIERESTDAIEAAILSSRIGESFSAVVIDVAKENQVIVQITTPAVVAKASGQAQVGDEVSVKLTAAEVASSTLTFVVEQGAAPAPAVKQAPPTA